MVVVDEFTERLAKVRQRFTSTLAGKVEQSYAALAGLSGDDAGAANVVEETYRRPHGICGIGPTVGFKATGLAARQAEAVLLFPLQAKRGLTANEVTIFTQALDALREAARLELQTTNPDQR
jgi:chemotaxis protein histidine kinase CheA